MDNIEAGKTATLSLEILGWTTQKDGIVYITPVGFDQLKLIQSRLSDDELALLITYACSLVNKYQEGND